jgi:hypothetical protein
MKLKSAFLFFLLVGFSPWLSAQSHPYIDIQLISNEQEADLNLDKKTFAPWAVTMQHLLDSVFINEQTKNDFMVLVTLHPDADPSVSLFSRPAVAADDQGKLLNLLKAGPKVMTRFVDYSQIYLIRTKARSITNSTFTPDYKDPYQLEQEAFKRAGLHEKVILLKSWAENHAIPVLAEAETTVDEKFSGVQYVSKMLHATQPIGPALDIKKLTDSSGNYWRGVMEMSPGNEIIPLSKIALLVADGKFDEAKEYVELLKLFGGKKMLATYYTEELSWRLEAFNKELQTRAQKGIEQHDKGNYDGAIAVYDGILNDYSASAWIRFERYYSQNRKNNEEKRDSVRSLAEWNKAKPMIYGCNPLYPNASMVSTGKEAYLLMRRLELSTLFKVKENLSKDLLKLGDIASDLGDYGYAAEVYWICFSRIKKEDLDKKEILPYFLYCLDKLGVKEIRKNYEGDFEKEFKKIEKEKRKAMEGSVVYKLYRVKE